MTDPGRRSAFVARARTRRELRGETRFRYAARVPWEHHVQGYVDNRGEWVDGLSQVWKPGDHVAIFARTDWGKTHLVLHGLAPLWPDSYRWLTVDVKGDDYTLTGWGHAVRGLPPRLLRDRYEEQVWRVMLPRGVANLGRNRAACLKALRTARNERGWVIHLNEVRALSDSKSPCLDILPDLEELWMRGRPHVTLIAETQRGAFAPGSMYDQSSHVYVGKFTDLRMRRRLAEIGGDTDNLIRVVGQLQEHEFAYVRTVDDVMQIVRAPG